MMNSRSLNIVKATVPLIQERSTELGVRFYDHLFSKYPELKNVFNQTHQVTLQQPLALIQSIELVAQNLDNLDTLHNTIQQIAHKHRSVEVKAEHYPIVGQIFLITLKEVLGSAATDDVLAAWAEAYEVIAAYFIQMERELYQASEAPPSHWRGFQPFTVVAKQVESDVITSFYLKPTNGWPLPSFVPGQYISLKITLPAFTAIRQYSLSDAPHQGYYRISVKREDGDSIHAPGVVSTYLHRQVQEGDTLWLTSPAGSFTLDLTSRRPVVFISGGVGQTPLLTMLNTIAREAPSRPIVYIHSARNGRVHAFKEHVARLSQQHQFFSYVCYEQPTPQDTGYQKHGFIDAPWLDTIIPSRDVDVYYCGPTGFMRSVRQSLLTIGVPEIRHHYEFFGPLEIL